MLADNNIIKKSKVPNTVAREIHSTVNSPTLQHGILPKFVQESVFQKGNANFDGWARRCRQDHHLVQAEARRNCTLPCFCFCFCCAAAADALVAFQVTTIPTIGFNVETVE